MLEYTFKPIEQWPGERTKRRQRARFNTQWGKTQQLLGAELRHLAAKNVVIQADCDDSQIRIRDGMLRADARLNSPGVILTFDSKHGPLSYPCDTYTHYQDNVRAIALALEALRKVDRYGVTKRAEQYKGWKKLPDPNSSTAMSLDAAVSMLSAHSSIAPDSIRYSADGLKAAYRQAARKLHPDGGGNHTQFAQLGEAKRIVEREMAL